MNRSRLIPYTFSIILAVASSQVWSFANKTVTPNPEAIGHTAKVLETMSSAGYTYIRVEEKDKTFWIALPQTPVKVGEQISFYEQMLMENFTSRTLNRTFDKILFVEGINKGAELPTNDQSRPSPNKQSPKQDINPPPNENLGKPVGRYTVKEIFEKKAELVEKVIEIKGKVTKTSMQIMGRDWIHIEDGTGTSQENNSKIIFRTTQGGINIGDEVIAKGVLYLNKDFGYGYFYPLIVENAVFTK